MPKRKPLAPGERFCRLIVTGPGTHKRNPQGDTIYHAEVLCDCGNRKSVAELALRAGMTNSCGCLQREWARSGRSQLRHGLTYTRTHRIWAAMLSRCTNTNQATTYPKYGAKGIRVCKRWQSFDAFLVDMGECPPGMSLDRINGKGDYKPSNCRWATIEQQNLNKTQTIPVMLDGELVSFSNAARRLGLLPATLHKGKVRYALTHQQAVDYYVAKRR